jgi:hypothetical protein
MEEFHGQSGDYADVEQDRLATLVISGWRPTGLPRSYSSTHPRSYAKRPLRIALGTRRLPGAFWGTLGYE